MSCAHVGGIAAGSGQDAALPAVTHPSDSGYSLRRRRGRPVGRRELCPQAPLADDTPAASDGAKRIQPRWSMRNRTRYIKPTLGCFCYTDIVYLDLTPRIFAAGVLTKHNANGTLLPLPQNLSFNEMLRDDGKNDSKQVGIGRFTGCLVPTLF